MFGIQKCCQENDMLGFKVREKNFCSPPDALDGFGRIVWDLGYRQKQTGWSYDASIGFYDPKRELVAIFSFS